MGARRGRLCVWPALTNILFIDESMTVQMNILFVYYMELPMDLI